MNEVVWSLKFCSASKANKNGVQKTEGDKDRLQVGMGIV